MFAVMCTACQKIGNVEKFNEVFVEFHKSGFNGSGSGKYQTNGGNDIIRFICQDCFRRVKA